MYRTTDTDDKIEKQLKPLVFSILLQSLNRKITKITSRKKQMNR